MPFCSSSALPGLAAAPLLRVVLTLLWEGSGIYQGFVQLIVLRKETSARVREGPTDSSRCHTSRTLALYTRLGFEQQEKALVPTRSSSRTVPSSLSDFLWHLKLFLFGYSFSIGHTRFGHTLVQAGSGWKAKYF